MNNPISLLFAIIYQVIAPIFLMMGMGYLVQKKLGFDIRTLTRLNFWIFLPAFLFVYISESTLSSRDIGIMLVHFCAVGVVMWGLTYQAARMIGARGGLRRAMVSAVLFYNAGNYGIPAAQLAFGAAGVPIQAIIVMMQNTTNFTIGLGLHAGAKAGSRKRDTLRAMLKLPMLHTSVLALLWRASGQPVPLPLSETLHYFANGLVPIALVTLGAQMATLRSYRFTLPIAITLLLRLGIAPLLAYFFAVWMHIPTTLMQSLVVATSFPVAVNTALLAIEFDNEPEYSSAVVFYSTLASILTVSGTILLMRLAG